MAVTSIGAQLVAEFERMVRRDGGEVVLLAEEGDLIRVGYRPGSAGPDCKDDVCVLPQHELRQLMAETLRRRAPGRELVMEVLP
ncbi:hypothetical protein [Nonomuraea cavernae]|uniref:Uncharacterized protein n=1 Tax=Nonomuraea cavernae TaxID=2045107 RepID=A0A917ZIP8_9ACTN|nr:hypothetical protein [Nonomuraea cavernae]MCA2186422.1 hypothetical protein [Nonomuraea cavernae]GGO82749.1 hypothetical protein GCM10012289_74720 [Nonomuraea cavernae]